MASEGAQSSRRIPFWGTVFAFLGVVILCTLGYWQVQRHSWKQQLISRIDSEYAVDASQVPLSLSDMEDYLGLKRGYFRGQYSHNRAILLQPRTYEGIAGYEVLTPFKFQGGNGQSILVNRGWIPHERDRSDPFLMDVSMDEVRITGMLRRPPRFNAFTPENDPTENVWYRVDLHQIARFTHVDLVDRVVFYAESEDGRLRKYPISASNRTRLSNNHLQYAVFWFSMAFFMIVVYWIRFIRKI